MPKASLLRAIASATLIAGLVACESNSDNDDPDEPTDPEPTQTAAVDPDPFDPCELLPTDAVAEHSEYDPERTRYQGLSIKDERVVECRLGGPIYDVFTVGFVAYDPPDDLTELMPNHTEPVEGQEGRIMSEPAEPLEGVGDEAYIGKSLYLYYIAARSQDTELLLTLMDDPEGEDQRENAIALAKVAVERLPDDVLLGQQVLPEECEALDSAAIEAITTEVALAQGSQADDTLICDYLGTGGTRIRASATGLTESNLSDLVEHARGNESKVEIPDFEDGADVFFDEDAPSFSAFVDDRYLLSLRMEARSGEDQDNDRVAPREAGEDLLRSLIAQARTLAAD